ncbi:MAG: PAS domain S-box protein [Sphingobacteriales bacterium JAD_PAG50586_3]|nr:MAG: PAS domain S-box protein [Sphingobacteriales bacterium JAD_PAG50586_3]
MNQPVQSTNGMEKFDNLLQTQINDLLLNSGIELDKLMPFLEAVNTTYTDKQASFKAIMDSALDIMCIIDTNGRITYESPSAVPITGYTNEETVGTHCFDNLHPDDLQACINRFKEGVNGANVELTQSYRFRAKNGDYLYFEAKASPLFENGELSGFVLNTRNATERVRMERQLTAQNHLLETIIRSMPVLLYKANKEGICTSISGNALNRIGKEEKDFIGVSLYDHFKDKGEEVAKAYSGEIVNFINKNHYKGEEMFFEHFLFTDELAGERTLIGFAMDITEGKQSQNRLTDYYETLEKTNKELDQFAYIVSHDLKAPLRAISNLSIWIEEDLEDKITEDSRTNFNLMRSRVVRMEQLINGILEYSRAGRMQSNPSQFNITTMVSETVNDLAPPANFAVEIQQDMPEITADRIKVEQVFSNFISNAIKYNSNPNPTLRIGYTEELDQHVFYVADNGPGIDPEYHEKVFVIFQTLQARDKIESTGVGLAIVKKIIEDAGGRVWLESGLGQGSTFYFSLPKMVAMAAA